MPLITPGNVFFTKYPYVEKQDAKTRPAMAIAANDKYIWALKVTTSESLNVTNDEFYYLIGKNECPLLHSKKSGVSCNIIMTFEQSPNIKLLSSVSEECLERIKGLVNTFFNNGNS